MRLALACLLVISASGSFAQTPPPLVETMEVRVINLDVVVTDKKGNRITGLTQDDFEVFDKGRKQDISNFSEIHEDANTVVAAMHEGPEGMTAPAAVPRRRRNTIIFFLDSTSIDPKRRHVVFDELRRFAANAMLPGDRAMIAVWNRSFHIALPFSESPEEIQLVLADVEKAPGSASMKQNRRSVEQHIVQTLRAEQESPHGSIGRAYEEGRASAFAYAEDTHAQLRALLASVSSTMTLFGGSEDKKAFVFVGEYLPGKAGRAMFQFVEDLFEPFNLPAEAVPSFDAISMAESLQKAVVAANASRVTIYMLASGDLEQLAGDPESDEPDPSPISRDIDRNETFLAFSDVAAQTGGLAFLGGKNPRNVLQQIVDDFHIYYSIGFRPSGAEGRQRSVRVRAKNPDYVVRTRNNYALRSVADEMADRVVANFHQAGSIGELGVSVERGLVQADGRNRIRLPVKVRVNGDRLTLIPKGDAMEGEVTVFVCAGELDSDASKVQRHTQRLHIPAGDEARFRSGYLTFDFEVMLRQKGDKVLSAGVLDTISGSYGTARKNVAAD
jgi:VWFA-related protein